MTFRARLAVIALACLHVVAWTCPAYCANAAEPVAVAVTQEIATAHEHHHSTDVQSKNNSAGSVDAVDAGCCGSCGVEQIPLSLTEKYSAFANAAANAIVPLPFSSMTGQRSVGPAALQHQPPGTSPPVTCVSPLRI